MPAVIAASKSAIRNSRTIHRNSAEMKRASVTSVTRRKRSLSLTGKSTFESLSRFGPSQVLAQEGADDGPALRAIVVAAGEPAKLRAGVGAGEGAAVSHGDDLVALAVEDEQGAPVARERRQVVERIAHQDPGRTEVPGERAHAREGRLEDQRRERSRRRQ